MQYNIKHKHKINAITQTHTQDCSQFSNQAQSWLVWQKQLT